MRDAVAVAARVEGQVAEVAERREASSDDSTSSITSACTPCATSASSFAGAWPRGVRRQRRELEAAREQLRRELGYEPSLVKIADPDVAKHKGR